MSAVKDALFIPHEAMRYAGFRALAAAVRRSGDPVGAALGMYLFSHAAWLAREMQQGGFDRIVFIARDGFWVKQAYDLVAKALGVETPSDYVRISRQAAFPLHFAAAEDLVQLPEWIGVKPHNPQSLMDLLSPVLRVEEAEAAMEAAGLTWTQRLWGDSLAAFIGVCQRLWDGERAAAYREHARAYIAPKFTGKCATFDVGYNLRSESVFRDLTGADITAFITHTDSDAPDRRGVPYHTLYPASPYVSWVAREQFLLEDAPLCVGYDAQGPALAAEHACVSPAITAVQHGAMAFVEDVISTYGAALAQMHLRPVDGCLPFEHFLHCGPYRQMKPFRRSRVENSFHAGAAGEDGTFLQWRLMQTDLRAAMGEPAWRVRLRRAMIRLQEDPRSFLRRLIPFTSE